MFLSFNSINNVYIQRWFCCLESYKCFFICENILNIIEQSKVYNDPTPKKGIKLTKISNRYS